jgi:hypothetical protein
MNTAERRKLKVKSLKPKGERQIAIQLKAKSQKLMVKCWDSNLNRVIKYPFILFI